MRKYRDGIAIKNAKEEVQMYFPVGKETHSETHGILKTK